MSSPYMSIEARPDLVPPVIAHPGRLAALVALPAALCLLGHAPVARPAPIEGLLMPGRVSRAHEKQENQCALCHDRTDRSRQAMLCLDCHDQVAVDLRATRGLHGRLPGIAGAQCNACHTEHLGRDGDIRKSAPAALDHRLTDFPLEGAHRALGCVACHEPGRPRRETSTRCGHCHAADDPHRGRLGEDCASCHDQQSWAGGRFDHDRANFRLEQAHTPLRCSTCHAGGRYKGTPAGCAACHRPDDTHAGARGTACADCHTSSTWTTSRFDHGRQARFPLIGGHARLACSACHAGGRFDAPLPRSCAGCHRADDQHAGRFGSACGDCHGEQQWSLPDWDHAARTGVALPEGHRVLGCHACHTAAVSQQQPRRTCDDCHRAADPHGGALGAACDRCHGTRGWRNDIRFDHDLSDYPLLGLHLLPTCAQCHTSQAFRGAPRDCQACHRGDDVHDGGLGRDCQACHSPNGWRLWDFDHAARARFELDGAHVQIACAACHRQPPGQLALPRDCASCHGRDDAHLGQFGGQCQHCHTTRTFQGARIQ